MVQGVAKLLRRAVRNLLENARRYSSGPVTVELRREGEHAVVRVRDQGPGVPAAERERIFEPFYRLAGASERYGGVGLGLALVRAITQRHHGSVQCEAPDGGGACFVVRIPCHQSCKAASPPFGGCQSGRQRLKSLQRCHTSTATNQRNGFQVSQRRPSEDFYTATARWLFFLAPSRRESLQAGAARLGLGRRVGHVHQPGHHHEVADQRREFDHALLAEAARAPRR